MLSNLITALEYQHGMLPLTPPLPWLGKIEWFGRGPVSLPRHAAISPTQPWLSKIEWFGRGPVSLPRHAAISPAWPWLSKIEWFGRVVLYPYHDMLPLAWHYHDVAKLNDLVVVLDPCHDTVEMFLCKHYLIGCPSHLIIIKVALAPCHDLGQTVSCRQFEH